MSAEQAADGLEILNQLLSSWNGENLMLPFRTTETLTYSASQSVYTIGSGGDLDTVRPIQIIDAYHDNGGTSYPMRTMTLQQYNNIETKAISTFPERYYYEPVSTLGKLYFDFQPTTAMSLILTSMKEVTAFASLDTSIPLASEYDRALRTNLMIDIAPEYGMSVSQETMFSATESKAAIKRIARANRESVMSIDLGLRKSPTYSIYKG